MIHYLVQMEPFGYPVVFQAMMLAQKERRLTNPKFSCPIQSLYE